MSDKSGIQWTDATWNPVRGCSRVSEGCRNCYAERYAQRFANPGQPFEGFARGGDGPPRWTGKVELIPEKLDQPLRWRKPRRIFVNSMSDLFHESLPDEDIDQVFAIMAESPWHTFQVLTKRPALMRRYLSKRDRKKDIDTAIYWLDQKVRFREDEGWSGTWPLPNIWLGVSVEDQATADERIPLLLETPAAVRFVSYEPALGPIDFNRGQRLEITVCGEGHLTDASTKAVLEVGRAALKSRGIGLIDWVIIGGESGPAARPFDLAWARSVISYGRDNGVPVFVKQLGASIIPQPQDRMFYEPPLRLRDRKGGEPSEWPKDIRVREFPR